MKNLNNIEQSKSRKSSSPLSRDRELSLTILLCLDILQKNHSLKSTLKLVDSILEKELKSIASEKASSSADSERARAHISAVARTVVELTDSKWLLDFIQRIEPLTKEFELVRGCLYAVEKIYLDIF